MTDDDKSGVSSSKRVCSKKRAAGMQDVYRRGTHRGGMERQKTSLLGLWSTVDKTRRSNVTRQKSLPFGVKFPCRRKAPSFPSVSLSWFGVTYHYHRNRDREQGTWFKRAKESNSNDGFDTKMRVEKEKYPQKNMRIQKEDGCNLSLLDKEIMAPTW